MDKQEKSLALLQELLNTINLPDKNIRYTECKLHGNHISDIAYTYSGRLIDFRESDLPLCAELRRITAKLNMPHSCENPTMAHLSYNEGIQKPNGIKIFRDNELISEKEFPADTEMIQINGVHGKVILEVNKNHTVRFTESSCTHKTCMTMGPINQAGQNLVCIPNRIVVTIDGKNISGVDSFTF